MKKTLSVEEIKVLILRAVDGNEMTIQQSSKDCPSFSFNIRVSKCVPIHNGIQFHTGKGYINLEFYEDIEKEHGFIEQQTYDLHFSYDHDKPKGYWVKIGEATLFFYGKQIEDILDNLKLEVKRYREEQEQSYELRTEADQMIPKEVWESIDNMMEK